MVSLITINPIDNIIACGKNIESKTDGRVWLATDFNSPLISKPGFFRRLFCNYKQYSKPKVADQLQSYVNKYKRELTQNADFVKYANLVYQKLTGSKKALIKFTRPATFTPTASIVTEAPASKPAKRHRKHKTAHAAPTMLAVRVTTPKAIAAEKVANAAKLKNLQIPGRELSSIKKVIEEIFFPDVRDAFQHIVDGKIHLPDNFVLQANQHFNKHDKGDYRPQGFSLAAGAEAAAAALSRRHH